jgi:hypothetical protein
MPKWIWYVAAALAVYWFVIRGLLARTAVPVAPPVPAYPPAALGGGYGVSPTVGNPTGGTSVSQDAANWANAVGTGLGALGGFIGQFTGAGGSGDFSGSYGPSSGGGSPDGWVQPDWG